VSSFSTFFFFGAACTNPPTACCCFFNIASECDANAPPGGFDSTISLARAVRRRRVPRRARRSRGVGSPAR
jgi:hypothetical protein